MSLPSSPESICHKHLRIGWYYVINQFYKNSGKSGSGDLKALDDKIQAALPAGNHVTLLREQSLLQSIISSTINSKLTVSDYGLTSYKAKLVSKINNLSLGISVVDSQFQDL